MPLIDVSVNAVSYVDFQVPMMDREKDYVFDLTNILTPPSGVSVDRNDWILKTAASESYAVHVIYDTLMTGQQFISYQDSVIVRGGSKPYTFSVTSGSLPAGLTLSTTTGIVSGTPTDSGHVTFTVSATGTSGGSDSKQITMRIAPGTPPAYVPGDANHDGAIDISDVVYLIAYIFSGGSAPVPTMAGDANGDCAVDISDAVYLIGYIFSGGTAPLPGC
ncbi:MAG: putative Ig domain-containing protein [candidate division Zixibacteria bacterium]|nr:putative Ig domain-containing protein [candidate division Zixibacteria bacterium]